MIFVSVQTGLRLEVTNADAIEMMLASPYYVGEEQRAKEERPDGDAGRSSEAAVAPAKKARKKR